MSVCTLVVLIGPRIDKYLIRAGSLRKACVDSR